MPENSSADTSNISSNPLFQQLVKISRQLDQALEDSRKKDDIIRSLTEKIDVLTEQVDAANTTIVSLTEQITLMAAQRYGKKSEKRSSGKKKDDDDGNDSDSTPSAGSASESDSSKKPNTHRPVKKKKTRKPKSTLKEMIERMGIDVEKVVRELDEDKRFCEYCGHELIPFGEKHLRYELKVELPRLRVIEYVGVTYGCPDCHAKAADSDTPLSECGLSPVQAEAPKPLLPGSWASSSFLAMAIAFKILYQIPTNLLITMFREMGMFSVSSGTLCSWIISVSQVYFAPLFDRLRQILLA
ncbi:IS66 family transposase zinc-finger binding domain-containing protein, partial [Ileibacterium valens]